MNRLVAIIGPTGIGKSKLALRLAQALNGEIVNADSRQVYCHMDIGTAKPAPEELALVPHHLINIVNPDDEFSLAHVEVGIELDEDKLADNIGKDWNFSERYNADDGSVCDW